MRPLTFEIERDGNEFHTWCPELPCCHTHGKTVDQAIENLKEVVQLCLEELIEEGMNELAAKYGISEMSMNEINEEIKAVAEPTEKYGQTQSLSKQLNMQARKKNIIQHIERIRSDVALSRLEKVLNEVTVLANISADIFKPVKKNINVEEMIREQNFTGIDTNRFENIVNELDIKEPLVELIKAV